jgi:hypothetical protein
MSKDTGTETCSFCDGPSGPWDDNRLCDSSGTCCGECAHRMDLDGELILNCGLCKFPVLGTIYMIAEHDYEYCESCYSLLRKAGF